MDFPKTNKMHQDINTSFGENAALLEEKLKQLNWKYYLGVYAALLGVTAVTLFVIVLSVKAALAIF